MTRTLLFQNNVPKNFWSEAVLIAVYLINRLSCANLFFKSPYEILYGRKINLEHLKNFGCTSFVHKNRLYKLDFTSIKTIFLGYSSQKKGYKCYDPKDKKLYISRDVFILENEPYFKISEGKYCDHNSSNGFMLPCDTNLEGRKICVENHIHVGDQENEDNMAPQEEVGIEEHEDKEEAENQRDEIPIRRSSRQTRPSSRLKDFVTYSVQYPIQDYISYDNITNDHYVFLNALS
jgi:hypothetical protein